MCASLFFIVLSFHVCARKPKWEAESGVSPPHSLSVCRGIYRTHKSPGTVSGGEHGTNPQQLVSLSLYQLVMSARSQQKQIPPTLKINTLICVLRRLYTEWNTEARNEARYRRGRLAADRNTLKLKRDKKNPNCFTFRFPSAAQRTNVLCREETSAAFWFNLHKFDCYHTNKNLVPPLTFCLHA